MVFEQSDNSPVLSLEQRRTVRRYALAVLEDIANTGNGLAVVVTALDAVYVIDREDGTIVRALPDAETAVQTLIARDLVDVAWNSEIRLRDDDPERVELSGFPLHVNEVGLEVLEVLGLIVD